ncbi:MAG: hypothetical protein KJ555_06980, partial [Proteobacteria bacterium]|nr:hypothetical protein [Pseudomonadota bacterium]
MKKTTQNLVTLFSCAAICLFLIAGCAPASKTAANQDQLASKASATTKQPKTLEEGQLPVRYQKPTYMLEET